MTAQELKRALGQCLGVGFDGYTVPDEFRELIREYKIGSVILFRRNVQSYEQLCALCDELQRLIQKETGLPAFIMADEECGSVSRLGHLTGATPSAMAIGVTGDKENARRIGRIAGEQLSAAGVNFNLAPVLDCFSNPDNTACGNRCFSSSPEEVAAFGLAYIRGLRETGVIACGKHFPGHGDTAVDSHLALPIVNKTLDEMRRVELVPFAAAVRDGVDAIMSAHVVFPAVEPERVPSTVSRRVLTGLLREEMGFDGLIVSDAMEMHAVLDLFGVEEGVCRALLAGVDIALICHSARQAMDTCRYLTKAYEEGRLTEEILAGHLRRIEKAKAGLRPASRNPERFGSADQRKEANEIMEASIRLLHAPEGKPLPRLDQDTLFFGTMARRNALVNDDIPLDAARELARALGGAYGGQAPEGTPRTAVVCLGRHPDMARTMEAAQRMAAANVQLVAVSLFTSRYLDALPDTVWKIAAWQYDELALAALTHWLRERRG